MNDIAIRCANVSKRFKIYDDMITGPMKEALFFWQKDWNRSQHYHEIVAVDDVSLEMAKGEVFGVIGPNGAGKTTLLKMIAGLLETDSGSIEVTGRVSAQLAHGVGIHPEFTGRENIYHSGVLLGMTDEEIARHTPEIVDFAELGQYIDLPYRTYSSGMQARLLFSISMSFTPDVMIIDEGLATGDAYFVHKCQRKIREICDSGATVLLASHDLMLVKTMCRRAMFLESGKVVSMGAPDDVIAAYDDWIFRRDGYIAATNGRDSLKPTLRSTGEIHFRAIRLLDVDGGEPTGFYTGRPMRIEMDYSSVWRGEREVSLFIGFLRADDGQWVGAMNDWEFQNIVDGKPADADRAPLKLAGEGTIVIDIDHLLLMTNQYSLWIMIYDKQNENCLVEYRDIRPFFVSRGFNSHLRGVTYFQPSRASVIATGAKDGPARLS